MLFVYAVEWGAKGADRAHIIARVASVKEAMNATKLPPPPSIRSPSLPFIWAMRDLPEQDLYYMEIWDHPDYRAEREQLFEEARRAASGGLDRDFLMRQLAEWYQDRKPYGIKILGVAEKGCWTESQFQLAKALDDLRNADDALQRAAKERVQAVARIEELKKLIQEGL